MRFFGLAPRTTPRHSTSKENLVMVDYFRILLNARLAKMEERGASAVEYGLLIAGIAALIVVAVFALGPVVKEAFSDTCASIKSGNSNISSNC
ncbi:Flp family type IVb pilin [Nocardioides sp. SOB77]|uniref:Flp family type IVb pilin n=1 Tax=Nocardioides oceani TaxID=3058369 RepID=A0ABT8FE58_9ACTN|nr:Flp family type IVb pilin [Nocardioides oceani]MDN4172969.1 Flp family type IVb pilin [Nocardioides oceani]